jgi:hypothetical protein
MLNILMIVSGVENDRDRLLNLLLKGVRQTQSFKSIFTEECATHNYWIVSKHNSTRVWLSLLLQES